MTIERLETIKQATIKIQGMNCLNAKPTKPAINKAEKTLLKLIDSVEQNEYCKASGNDEKLNELDFND